MMRHATTNTQKTEHKYTSKHLPYAWAQLLCKGVVVVLLLSGFLLRNRFVAISAIAIVHTVTDRQTDSARLRCAVARCSSFGKTDGEIFAQRLENDIYYIRLRGIDGTGNVTRRRLMKRKRTLLGGFTPFSHTRTHEHINACTHAKINAANSKEPRNHNHKYNKNKLSGAMRWKWQASVCFVPSDLILIGQSMDRAMHQLLPSQWFQMMGVACTIYMLHDVSTSSLPSCSHRKVGNFIVR